MLKEWVLSKQRPQFSLTSWNCCGIAFMIRVVMMDGCRLCRKDKQRSWCTGLQKGAEVQNFVFVLTIVMTRLSVDWDKREG